MSAKPYSEADLASIRDIVRRVPVTDGTVEHWLATVDALQSRLAAAEAERDDLRRYRKSWDKELRDAREAARAAIDGRIAAEAEAERARGLLEQARRCVDQTIELGWESSEELLERIDAHLASRPEGEVAGG